MDSLFDAPAYRPLADRMRPRTLAEFTGQDQAAGPHSLLRRMLQRDSLQSLLFYGPPGTGKTTLAQIIAHMTRSHFVPVNAVSSGVPELRRLIAEAQATRAAGQGRTIVFIDEIRRFNKAQQDVLLPYVENGTIILIGATTENPFFEINSPLLSRLKILRLERLQTAQIEAILQRALTDRVNGLGAERLTLEPAALHMLADVAQGDARSALNLLEQAALMVPEGETEITAASLQDILGTAFRRYDKKGDAHYDIVSAFIKSMRGSDPDAAIHYLARMLEGGEDLRFIARPSSSARRKTWAWLIPRPSSWPMPRRRRRISWACPKRSCSCRKPSCMWLRRRRATRRRRLSPPRGPMCAAATAGTCRTTCATPITAAPPAWGTARGTGIPTTIPTPGWTSSICRTPCGEPAIITPRAKGTKPVSAGTGTRARIDFIR